MRLGYLGGFLTGVVLSAVALGAISVLIGRVTDIPPKAASPEVPPGSEFNQSREDREASLPEPDATPGAESTPMVAVPEPDDLSPLADADTTPATPPVTGQPETSLSAPRAEGDETGVAVDSDEPVLPSPQALPPEEPLDETGLVVATEPAAPPAPAETPAEMSDEVAIETPETPAETPAETPVQTPEAPVPDGESADEQSISAEPAQPRQPDVETGSGLFGDDDTPGESADTVEEPEPELPEPAMDDPAAEEASEDDTPSGTIGNLAEGVTTGRLPAVTDAPVSEATEPDPAAGPALERFAVPFENPEGKPLMAIVLIDDGASPISFEALADFPYPISYAIDASWSGAAEAAKNYRAAGLEVMALVDLPEDFSARDTEVAMQSYLRAVPQAVAVMEGLETGLQSSREAAEQLVPILQDSGLGLVMFSEGLDTTRKLIAREGVPVAPVFRDFDAEGQNARVIRRFLDQAAFRAAQEEGGVVMVGRLRAETVSALLLWGLQDRAGSVALGPISALLKARVN